MQFPQKRSQRSLATLHLRIYELRMEEAFGNSNQGKQPRADVFRSDSGSEKMETF